MSETLLHKFIIEKFKSYLEPQRKGTRRGDPIGFSSEKYMVSLYMLYNYKQKDIAKTLNISHGLLRKWNTEKLFKAAVTLHCIEFAEYILAYLKEKINKDLQQQEDFLKKPINEIASYTPSHWNFEVFKDSKFYSPLLEITILDCFGDAIKKNNDLAFASALYAVVDVLRHFSGIKQSALIKEKENDYYKMIKNSLLKDVKKIFLKKTITEDDRKKAVFILSLLEQTTE